MSIKNRATGCYFDALKTWVKKNGVYQAVQSVFVKDTTYKRTDNILDMPLGLNAAWLTTWEGAILYNNLCLTMDFFSQQTGTGAFTQSQGQLTATVSTDTFRAYLSDQGLGLPAGTYTVINPDGCKIAIGNFSTPTAFHAWTTATQFTFEYAGNPSVGFMGVWLEGSLTRNNGNLAVILPGQLANHQAGNKWNPEFISYMQGLNLAVLRMMDCNVASNNLETDWGDRAQPNRISYVMPDGMMMPWEDMCDLANRLDLDLWINVPHRATDAYVTALCNLLVANLPADREVWVELGNEIWNYAAPWGNGSAWIQHLTHTRYTLTANYPANTWTLTGHPFTNGEKLISFNTKENRAARISTYWQLNYGGGVWVNVLDANTIELKDAASGGATIPVTNGQINALVVKDVESGKLNSLNTNYGLRCVQVWDIFDAILGKRRVKHLICAQAAVATTTQDRMNATGVAARADMCAIAVYVNGAWHGGRITPGNTNATPGLWVNATQTAHFGVYAQGSTPTIQNIIDGTGTGYVGKSTWTASASTSGVYTDGTVVTGLVNGTTYTGFFVIQESNGRRWMFPGVDFTPAASGATVVYAYDTNEHQADRFKMNFIDSTAVSSHAAVSQGKPIIMYEGGPDFNKPMPSQLVTWIEDWLESVECRDALKVYLQTFAAKNLRAFVYYADCLGYFALSDSYADTADQRYQAYATYQGKVAKRTQVSVADITPPFLAEPGAYPATVATFATSALDYRIINGDNNGNYAIVGDQLRIINGNGITWSGSTQHTLLIEATDGFTCDTFTATFFVGSESWYEADALWAWSTVDDTTTAQVNPARGNALSLTSAAGTEAVAGSGLWDMNGSGTRAAYESNTALSAGFQMGDMPFLWAFVIEKDSHATQFNSMVQLSSGSRFLRATWNTGDTFVVRNYNNGIWDFNLTIDTAIPTTKSVCWVYYDNATGEWHSGINQTDKETHVQSATGHSLGQYIGLREMDCKMGSIQLVRRSGLTKAQAKAIVQKMQTHHGI